VRAAWPWVCGWSVDAPLAADDPGEVLRAGAVRGQAGDGMDDFLAGQRAVGVVAVTTGPGDPADVREVGAGAVGDPDGPADDPAVRAVQFRVIGVAGAPAWMAPKTARCSDGWFPLTSRK
jgi:hypothetical protein